MLKIWHEVYGNGYHAICVGTGEPKDEPIARGELSPYQVPAFLRYKGQKYFALTMYYSGGQLPIGQPFQYVPVSQVEK